MSRTYKPGDEVWIKDWEKGGQEIAGTVVSEPIGLCLSHFDLIYGCETIASEKWRCCASILRPRKDDYQQHERLVTKADIDTLVNLSDEKVLEPSY